MQIDFLQEANVLLEELGRLHRVLHQNRDAFQVEVAEDRFQAAFERAERLLTVAAPFVLADAEQQWGYRVLSFHCEIARVALPQRGISPALMRRLRDRSMH